MKAVLRGQDAPQRRSVVSAPVYLFCRLPVGRLAPSTQCRRCRPVDLSFGVESDHVIALGGLARHVAKPYVVLDCVE
jgi:hypothetical protein